MEKGGRARRIRPLLEFYRANPPGWGGANFINMRKELDQHSGIAAISTGSETALDQLGH